MDFFSLEQLRRLRENGALWLDHDLFAARMEPVAKLYTPDAACTWLVAAVHPHDPDRILALCDVADGDPQIRWTSLQAVAAMRGTMGRPVARDDLFVPTAKLGAYYDDARRVAIVTA